MQTASLSPIHIVALAHGSWLMWATPSEARFLQVDPVGYRDQTHLYAYVGNDPVNGLDPTGEFTVVAVSDAAARKLEAMFDQMAAGQFRFNGQRELGRVGDTVSANPTSATYAQSLQNMIASPEVAIMDVNTTAIQHGAVANVDANYGGGVTSSLNSNFTVSTGVKITVSGNSYSGVRDTNGGVIQQSPAEILMHEVEAHGEPLMTGQPQTLQDENQVRRELRLPERALDPRHPQ